MGEKGEEGRNGRHDECNKVKDQGMCHPSGDKLRDGKVEAGEILEVNEQ